MDREKLTDHWIRNAVSRDKTIRKADHELRGLWLRITATGHKSWSLQCRDKLGVQVTRTIGAYPDYKLKDAREAAYKIRAQLKAGSDPLVVKREEKALAAKRKASLTLASLVELYEKQKGGSQKTWHHAKGKILRMLGKMVDRPLLALSLVELQAFIDDYPSKSMGYAAARFLVPVFKWGSAISRNHCSAEFTKLVSPMEPKARKRVVSVAELQKILPALRLHRGDGYHDCMAFILLTLLRREEAATLQWNMVDWKERVIRLPETKNGETHVLPLSTQAIALLEFRKSMNVPNDFVFVNSVDRPMVNWHRVQLALMKETGTNGWHRHDLRRTGATLLGEMGFHPHIIEAALNHVQIHSQIASIYNRARYRPEVANALQALANKLDALETGNFASNIVALNMAS
jgi:integrase